ncbi:TonB-dependent receptor [Colwellia sp. MB02u-18]|uniref:TonB-dependent receptor n=1 Tax=unclassified Colwellia TaxID=196834 RepID=UPI0015F61B6F|nr:MULTISPECIES: TonB-dependent receptor [unclassified Colwellia]MBA6224859.1 TonB-dependent receptor [Colwellia sp. MB3u-45]MBA6268853.1 TonB-dependent receptor [Colwellia sp. MB3u-43]MBA6321284.1 TonB-dependent receptor [Colwellia sp. MB02u-19]MBA6325837.1 TonB-dependent receptor [Colwellia sp. MB02u-18]MBA6332312.1 TonB-dependent receptor [Colwellia sp. MB02u-12]
MTFIKSPITLAILTSIVASTTFAADTPINTAEQTIEVITIDGDFRSMSLQKTASSLSVIASDEISARNAQNLEEIIARTPNVNFSSGTQRARYYQIRGIGERSQFKEPINPSVGLVIDGIDFSSIGSIASTFDVEQVEVYRGPQGTRFGANAMAGMINITSSAPTDVFEGKVRLSAGNYDSYSAGLVLSGPATEKVNYRLAVEQYRSDGFIDNDFLNRDDTNNRDELTMRGKLAIAISKDLTLDITTFIADFDNGYDAFSLDNTRHTLSDQPGFDRQDTKALATKFTYQGFSDFTLETIISYADSALDYGYDEDWAYVGIRPAWEYSSEDHYFRDKTSATFELRALSEQGSEIFNGSTAWVTGIYFKQEKEDLLRQYTYLSSDFSSSFDSDNIAAFIQFDSQLTQQLSLTTGLRLERRNADYTDSEQLSFDPSDTMVGGKVVLSYQADKNNLFYGSVNRGYKAGGANTEGSLPTELREFTAEYLWNYELGYKVSLLDNQAYVRSAVFYMDRDDMQVRTSFLQEREDGSTDFVSYLGNAATGTNLGLELEAGWQISPELEIYGAVGLLDTQYNGFIDADGNDKSGDEQAHAPSYQFNLGLNYQLSDHLRVNISVDGKDEFLFSDSHNEKSAAIEVVNMSMSYAKDDWQVKVWARNLFDESYATRGFYFGNDPRDEYSAKAYYQLAEPAVFGATFDYNF